MAEVWIPRRLQHLTHGEKQVRVPGATIRQLIDELEARYPGLKSSLYDADSDALAPGLAVMIDGESTQLGLLERIDEDSEVHFLPAIAGGR